MLSRLHNKLGTAGLVVAIVALIAALGGAAIAAAPKLNSTQKKEVKKIAKTEAKKVAIPGPAGPAGPAGAPGQAGAKGDKGDKGQQGEPGEDGADGIDGEDGVCSVAEPECVLPPGATLEGHWGVGGFAPSGVALTGISFGLSVIPAPTPVFVKTPGESTNCPGTVEAPDAKPGFLCIYSFFTSGTPEIQLANSGGVNISVVEGTEPPVGAGTWAVTAE